MNIYDFEELSIEQRKNISDDEFDLIFDSIIEEVQNELRWLGMEVPDNKLIEISRDTAEKMHFEGMSFYDAYNLAFNKFFQDLVYIFGSSDGAWRYLSINRKDEERW